MKIHPPILSLVLSIPLAGCHPGTQTAETPLPRIEGGKVALLEGSPQMASVLAETAQPCERSISHFNGRLVWDDDVTVRIFTPFAGRVIKIPAEAGQAVTANEPLAMIASPDYGQAQADARKAASDFVLAQRTFNRVRELFEHGAAPQKDLNSAEADLARALSEVQRTAARLAFYGGNTNSIDQVYQLKSPLAGIVVEKNINPGQEVRPDQMLANAPQFFSPLFVITDPTRLWIQLDMAEQDLPHLKPGQTIAVHARAFPTHTFSGKIVVVSDFLDPATRTIKVRGVVENPERLLKAEMFVNVDLLGDGQSGMDISLKAVFLKGEKHYVFLEEGRGQFARREIKVGPEHEGKILVLDGIQPGQRVVTDGCLLLEQMLHAAEGS
jgi:membrane fusion protein, heavy metal efflux system